MQTDLKMQSEINSEDDLNLFWDGGLWCSAKLWLQNIYYGVLTIRCFPVKAGALNDCFLQNICSKNQIVTQISIARERLNILDFQFYSFISKVSEVYSKLTAPLRFSPEVENKYYYQPKQTNNY